MGGRISPIRWHAKVMQISDRMKSIKELAKRIAQDRKKRPVPPPSTKAPVKPK